MPVQNNNIVMAGLRGALGRQVVFRQRNGKTFVSAYPDMSDRVLSPKQLKVNKIMKEAAEHATAILNDEQKRKEALFRLELAPKRLYNALVKEYFKAHYHADSK